MTSLAVERDILLACLNAQRQHIMSILEGLDETDLHRATLSSGWTCLGLVQHLTLDVERFWFGCVVANEPAAHAAMIDHAWKVDAGASSITILEAYRTACEQSNATIAATALDAAPAWWPTELFGDFRMDSLREIMLHVITETATHAGHLDIVRELIDGRQWLVLTA